MAKSFRFQHDRRYARQLDQVDPLRLFRSHFHIPKVNGKTAIYFTGNSLGLQPKAASSYIQTELKDWATLGVEGHFHSKRPWLYYHRFAKKALARITGSLESEVVAMNQLTVNLHLMLVSFYRPQGKRCKIVMEAGAFPSDQYAVDSQIRFHGLNPSEVLVEISPRPGEVNLRTEDIVATLHHHRDEIALVLLSGVQYYTGQLFDLATITRVAHDVGAFAGFDLAHAVGNVPLSLHDDNVDFAVWCSYKYLNSGPGGIAGAFIHERNFERALPRFEGWWGYQEETRFQMKSGFVPMPGVDAWQLSNFPVLSGAAHLASLELFLKAGMQRLRKKSVQLTSYAEFLLRSADPEQASFRILTPSDPNQRGCQLSIFMLKDGRKVFNTLTKSGVIADWREPNVIRIAPVPMYNTFEEVWHFAQVFGKAIQK